MRKRILSTICAFAILVSAFAMSIIDVNASEFRSIDDSYLTMEETSTGKVVHSNTRGIHLMDGECSITNAGRGHIYVYASTTANHDVDYLSTVIYVDRYNQETKKWGQIAFWQVEETNNYFVSTSKMLAVDTGYYYRVHADHVAGMDSDPAYEEATSATDGIFID